MKRLILTAVCLGALVFTGCYGPFSRGGDAEDQILSIYNKDKFLEINEFHFPEYQWGRDAKAVEEMYIDAMVEYFFRNRYEKTLLVCASALKVYPKDARVYTRMMESYARLGQEEQALALIPQADAQLNGFSTHPGISRYRFEMEQTIAARLAPDVEPERGLVGKILHAPMKITALWPF